MSEAIPNLVYSCEPWEIDLGRRELRTRGTPVALGNRAFEIVEALAEAGGRLVTKDDLMDRIWPGAVVGDNTLHVHISAVRKALGPDRAMLKTSPGRGYRLVGDWTVQPGETIEAPSVPPPRMQPTGQPPTNFPVIVTQLVGRSTAIQRVRDLVSAYRAVTVTGPGGIGKTVLAMKAVRGLLADFAHGAWLVELASLSDGSLVPSAVAGELGLKLSGGQVTAEALARSIGNRHLLILLDNCEHLIEAVAALVEAILRLCPRTTILATSRDVMRIGGEFVYRVPVLDVPPPEQEGLDVILGHSAVELFITRVKALDSNFALQPEDIPSIAEICRHLDGIPLAIEFAAARAAFVGTQQVLAMLRDRFTLLTSGRRTATPRHQTLRATLDWSYQLLSPVEQRLLGHLAIFPAGFTFDAAEAVGGGAGPSIVEALSSLVSKSLCERVNSTPLTRWRLLETIRTYALERLIERGEYQSAARRFATYFRDLISPVTANPKVWLSQDELAPCGREIDNVRAALDWAFSPDGAVEIGATLTVAFAPVWQMLLLIGECRQRIEHMLARRPPDLHFAKANELHMWLAYAYALAMTLASVEQTRTVVKRAVNLAGDTNDVEASAGLIYMQWSVEFVCGDYGVALTMARRLVEVTARGREAIKSVGERLFGTSLLYAGRLTEAQNYIQRVVDHHAAPAEGKDFALLFYDSLPLALARLARALCLRGYVDRAREEARSGFDKAQLFDGGITACWVLQDASCPLAFMTGDLIAAESAIAAMNAWADQTNATLWKMMATYWTGKLFIERGEFTRGIELISPTLDACEQSGWRVCYAQFLSYFAEALIGLGRLEEAGVKLDQAIAWTDRNGEGWYRAELMRMKGELLLRRSPVSFANEAEDCFRAANEIAQTQGALFWELRIALSLARLRITENRHDEARQLLAPVYDRFTEGFDTLDLRTARALLDGASP